MFSPFFSPIVFSVIDWSENEYFLPSFPFHFPLLTAVTFTAWILLQIPLSSETFTGSDQGSCGKESWSSRLTLLRSAPYPCSFLTKRSRENETKGTWVCKYGSLPGHLANFSSVSPELCGERKEIGEESWKGQTSQKEILVLREREAMNGLMHFSWRMSLLSIFISAFHHPLNSSGGRHLRRKGPRLGDQPHQPCFTSSQ